MYFLYSSRVVAPIHCISPLERAGFKTLDASIAPSAPPAPTNVCSSSMKRIIFFALRTSPITALILSSNWPRYFVPATIIAKSKATILLSRKSAGTAPLTTDCANPSTIAVFPTPASPSKTGLFFVRRLRTWIKRSITDCLPITGSSS